MTMPTVPLSDAIEALREELTRSLDNKPEEGIVFDIQSLELELQVVAATSTSGKLDGGWSLLGWKLGGEVAESSNQTGVHKVKIQLQPKNKKADGTTENAQISGDGPNRM